MKGVPEPALQPLHPEKPEPQIEPRTKWQKIATGNKTSQNAPQCEVTSYDRNRRAQVRVLHTWGPLIGHFKDYTERVFRRDWRKVSL